MRLGTRIWKIEDCRVLYTHFGGKETILEDLEINILHHSFRQDIIASKGLWDIEA